MTETHGRKRYSLRYARVYFHLQHRFGLSLAECVLADAIATLSRRTGWCYASREYLASLFGTTPRSIRRSLSRLREAGLVENASAFEQAIRPTALWYVETRQEQVSPGSSAEFEGRT